MKIGRSKREGRVVIDLSIAEAHVFLDELAHIRGGSKLPKVRQVCAGLEATFSIGALPSKGAVRK